MFSDSPFLSWVLLPLFFNIYQICGQENDDIFNTHVTISPLVAKNNDIVTLTCDFALIDGKDLAVLYWETTNGQRIFTYTHKNPEAERDKEHEPYKGHGKLLSYEYEVLEGNHRRHTLKMKVDLCDEATYRCVVLNQEDFDEGSDQKKLEIEQQSPVVELSETTMTIRWRFPCQTSPDTHSVKVLYKQEGQEQYSSFSADGTKLSATQEQVVINGEFDVNARYTGEIVTFDSDGREVSRIPFKTDPDEKDMTLMIVVITVVVVVVVVGILLFAVCYFMKRPKQKLITWIRSICKGENDMSQNDRNRKIQTQPGGQGEEMKHLRAAV